MSESEKSSSIKIKASLGVSNTILYLALGWFSRECKINIAQVGYGYKISL
ncbi:MAG: winged helix-turn-helix domain-containing protein [Endomicrobium sp.]|nr:winged helix-turn-helix domain-containing protein [Endomicrobium sp.]